MKSMKMSRELEEELLNKLNPHTLVIVHAGADQIIGELLSVHSDGGMDIKNPRRILRLQQVEPSGAVVFGLMIADFDFIAEGTLTAYPDVKYHVREQSESSKISIYSALIDYFDRKVENQAQDAGLVLPKSPFRKR